MHSDHSFQGSNSEITANSSGPVSECQGFSREKALIDIKSQQATILIQGGIVSVIKMADRDFEKKFKISFRDLGCVIPDKIECLIAYNQAIFEYLDKTYGKEWRKEIRKDAIGLNNH